MDKSKYDEDSNETNDSQNFLSKNKSYVDNNRKHPCNSDFSNMKEKTSTLKENLNDFNTSKANPITVKEQNLYPLTKGPKSEPTSHLCLVHNKSKNPKEKPEKKSGTGDISSKLEDEPLIASASTGPKPESFLSKLPIIKLWVVFILTVGFWILLMIGSHLTHSLTLRVEAYHALYNLMALGGCLFTLKIWDRPASIKNTFGWARVEVLSCLCSFIFVASFCFSVAMESIQTAAHAGHQDPMHHPLQVIVLGLIGIGLNLIVLILIGGYTHHQGCFLHHRGSDVWIQNRTDKAAVQEGLRTMMNSSAVLKNETANYGAAHESLRGFLRDVAGLVVVMVCATVVHFDVHGTFALYVDPGFAVLSVSILLVLSFPYGKECCYILLQTIPANIDVEAFSAQLLEDFPEVINVHHLHIWSLTPGKVVATAHVVYSNPEVFREKVNDLKKFFTDQDITQVTLQPEFIDFPSCEKLSMGNGECLIKCNNLCREKECCDECSLDYHDEEGSFPKQSTSSPRIDARNSERPLSVSVCSDHHGTSAFRRSDSETALAKCGKRNEDFNGENKDSVSLSKHISRSIKQHDVQSHLNHTDVNRVYKSTNF